MYFLFMHICMLNNVLKNFLSKGHKTMYYAVDSFFIKKETCIKKPIHSVGERRKELGAFTHSPILYFNYVSLHTASASDLSRSYVRNIPCDRK